MQRPRGRGGPAVPEAQQEAEWLERGSRGGDVRVLVKCPGDFTVIRKLREGVGSLSSMIGLHR